MQSPDLKKIIHTITQFPQETQRDISPANCLIYMTFFFLETQFLLAFTLKSLISYYLGVIINARCKADIL